MLEFIAYERAQHSPLSFELIFNHLVEHGDVIGRNNVMFYVPNTSPGWIHRHLLAQVTSPSFIETHAFPGEHRIEVRRSPDLYTLLFKTTLVETNQISTSDENYEVTGISYNKCPVPKENIPHTLMIGRDNIMFYVPTIESPDWIHDRLTEILSSREFIEAHAFPGEHRIEVMHFQERYTLLFKTTLVETNQISTSDENYEVTGISYNKCPVPEENIPHNLMISNVNFHLSSELRKGLDGNRSSDHQIDLGTLKKALKKKIPLFRKKNRNAFDIYVRVIRNDWIKILNLVIKRDLSQPRFVIITAYYMEPMMIKGRFRMNQTEFERWAADRSIIYLDDENARGKTAIPRSSKACRS